MERTQSSTTSRYTAQVHTFYLLWCEHCGHAGEPMPRLREPEFVAPSGEPLRCNDCGELLHLIECFTAPQSKMWQAAPGSSWHHVAYRDQLPKSTGRTRWIEP